MNAWAVGETVTMEMDEEKKEQHSANKIFCLAPPQEEDFHLNSFCDPVFMSEDISVLSGV